MGLIAPTDKEFAIINANDDRVDLHDDMILIDRFVDRRDLPLSKGIIKRVVNLTHDKAQARGRVAINRDIGLKACLLLIGIDVGKNATVLQGFNEVWHKGIKLVCALSLKSILILSVALPAAGMKILR